MKKVLVLSDLHVPFHDADLLTAIMKYCRDLKPDEVILNGDLVDFYSVSRFDKSPHRAEDLQYELDCVAEVLEKIRKANPKAIIRYIMGNHEERLKRFLGSRAKALYNLNCLKFHRLIRADEFNIKLVDYCYYPSPKFVITHGNRYGEHPAKNLLMKDFIGFSGLSGHAHRRDFSVRTSPNKMFFWNVSGHLADQSALEYAKHHRWVQGFAVLKFSSGHIDINMVDCDKRGFIVDGKVYKKN